MREKYEGIFRDAINRLGSVMDKRRDQPVLKDAEQQDERKRQLDELKHLLVDQVHDLVKNTVISSEEDIDQLCLAIDGLKTTIAQKYKAANIEAGFQFAKKDWEEFLAEAQEIREETRRGLIDFLHGKGELIGEDANTPVKQNNGGDKVVETSYEDEFLDIVTSPNPPEWLRPFQKEIESMIGKVDNSVLVKLAGTIRSEYEKRNQLIGGAIENAEKEKNEAEELAREMQSRLVTQADQVGRLEKLNAEKVRENENLARKNADQKAELKLKEEALAVYRSMAKELDRTKADLERVKLGFKDEIRFHDAEETRLKEKIVEVSGNLAAAKREIASLKEKLSKNTVTEEERAVQAEQAEENGRLKGDLEKQNQTIELARREVDAVTERHRLAEEKIQELERLIDELWKAGEKLGGESIAFKAQLEKTASELEMLSGAINILEQETKNKDNKYAEDIDELRRHLDNSGRLLEKTQALLDTSNGIIDSLRNDNEEVLRLTGELHDSEQLVDAQLQRIDELLVKLGDEQKKNQELEGVLVSNTRVDNPNSGEKVSSEKIEKKKNVLEEQLREIDRVMTVLSDYSIGITDVFQDLEVAKEEYLENKRREFQQEQVGLLASQGPGVLAEKKKLKEQALKLDSEKIDFALKDYHDLQVRIEEERSALGAKKRILEYNLNILNNVDRVLIDSPDDKSAYLDIKKWDKEMGKLAELVEEGAVAFIDKVVGQAKSPEGAKAIADIGDTAKVSVGEVDGLGAKIKELPFSIRSPEAKEKEQIILLEETINKMYGLGGDKLKAILPLVYHDEYEERNYNQLIKDLDSGEFLPKLKRAFAFFGAMRVGEDFKARISVVINNAIATKDAGLVHGEFADRARMASAIGSNVLQEAAILGKISSDELRLLKRIPVGSARGMASQLTPLGKIASQVWTKELLEKKEITVDQLKALSRATEALDKRRAEKKDEYDKNKKSPK